MDDILLINNDQLIISNIIISFFSVIVSIITILLYSTTKSLQTFHLSMMFGIAISEVVNGIGHIMSFIFIGVTQGDIKDVDIGFPCNLQRFLLIFPDLSTMLFLVFLSYGIYDLIINNSKELENKIKLFVLLGVLIPLGITIVISIILYCMNQESFDIKDGYKVMMLKRQCWTERSSTISIILYVVYFVLNGIVLFFIIKVILFMKKEMSNSPKMIGIKNKLYDYPIVGSLCFVFVVFYRAHEICFPGAIFIQRHELALRLYCLLVRLHGTFLSLRGVLLFIIFISEKKVILRVREIIEKVFNTNLENISFLQIGKREDLDDNFEITEEKNEEEDYNDLQLEETTLK